MADLPQFTQWKMVPDHLKTKTQLGREGLRPARGQHPAARFYSHGYKRTYQLYDVGEAVAKRTATLAQLAALEKARAAAVAANQCDVCGYPHGKKSLIEGTCRYCRDRQAASQWASDVLQDRRAVILDTETTGLNETAQIVEIAVITVEGVTLLDSLVKPTAPIPAGASEIHGLDDRTVADAPPFADLYPRLFEIVSTASRLIIYNADYDLPVIEYTAGLYHLPALALPAVDCAMEAYAEYVNDWSDYHGGYKWQRLNGGHRAHGDCLATLDVIRKMVQGANK